MLREQSVMGPGVRKLRIWLVLLLPSILLFSACERLTPQQQADKYLAKAREDVKAGKKADAIIEYRRAIQADSGRALLHFELGQLYVERQDLIDGAWQLSAAVSLDPSNFRARLRLADLL